MKKEMTVGAGIAVQEDGTLAALGATVLTEVRDNVLVTPAAGAGVLDGAFLGVRAAPAASRSVFPVGKLRDLRFMCTFRFKMWWMTQRMGSSGRDVPVETQFMLVEAAGAGAGDEEPSSAAPVYTVFLPILEGSFRAVLQGNADDELEICLESGDPAVESFEGTHLVFVGAGSDPFEVITNAVKVVERHLQTFSHREKKKMPDMLNWFGWCTWDAFYTSVSKEGVKEGLQSFEKGGTTPKFVIIDDGWQSVSMDPAGTACISGNSANFANRLYHIKENHKFQKNGRKGHREEDPANGLAHIVSEIKEKHELKYVYIWHAITGYWGGVRPGVEGMDHYRSKIQHPVPSPGVRKNESCDALDSITANGLGLVSPDRVLSFYNELHSYLASAGVDGVKVDVQNVLETLGAGHGGRVALARKYQQALEASVARNFGAGDKNGVNMISCMSHNTDNLYSSKRSAVVRASDDFWPRDPASHTIHAASVAYNTVFLGEFMQPDWDMFHSVHPMAEYHAAARAVGGCAIYVSDKPGNHDFDLLSKLVLPDGSILRARLPGRPTADCLFSDPARDGKSILKIWNLNEHTGVIGAFNCQGAGWCRDGKRNLIHDALPGTVTGAIRASDVSRLADVAGADDDDGWDGDVVVYSHKAGEVTVLRRGAALPVTLRPREHEVFAVAPLRRLPDIGGVSFAPIGLLRMFNAGGAVTGLRYDAGAVEIRVRGAGTVGAYASTKPKRVAVDTSPVGFAYDDGSGLVTFEVATPEKELYSWAVTVEF